MKGEPNQSERRPRKRKGCECERRLVDKKSNKRLKPNFGNFTWNNTKIVLTQYAPNHLVYSAKVKTNRTAVFSEIYYPEGWNCYIDGKLAEVAQVNFILRAAVVPAGEHQVEWKFEPAVWERGTNLSSIGSMLMILLLLGTTFWAYKKR